MSELISKKQAATAFIDGEDVEFMDQTGQWRTIFDNTVLRVFIDRTQFRLKPRTITLNGIEVPAPFKSKPGELYYHPCGYRECGYWFNTNDGFDYLGAWRTEEEIKQVVAALRSIFNPQ